MTHVRHRRRTPSNVRLPSWWRRHPLFLGLVILAAAGAILDRSLKKSPFTDDFSRYHNQSARVVYVVDGDTFDVDIPDRRKPHTRIRLWGVDTPEVGMHDTEPMYFGAEASRYAKQTLLDQPVRVELAPERTRDRYGRLLAYVYLADTGQMFNEMLLETGHAYADKRFAHAYKVRFTQLERQAQTAAAGLWAGVTFDQFPPWKQRMDKTSRRK